LDSCSSEECCLPGVRFDGRTAPGEAEALGDSCPQIRVHPPPQRDGALLHLALYSIGHVTDDVAHEGLWLSLISGFLCLPRISSPSSMVPTTTPRRTLLGSFLFGKNAKRPGQRP